MRALLLGFVWERQNLDTSVAWVVLGAQRRSPGGGLHRGEVPDLLPGPSPPACCLGLSGLLAPMLHGPVAKAVDLDPSIPSTTCSGR